MEAARLRAGLAGAWGSELCYVHPIHLQTILGETATEANLMLTNLIEGRYLFNLTVWDVSSKSHSTIAELIVRTGVEQENALQLYMRRGVRKFSSRWSRKLADRLSAALGELSSFPPHPNFDHHLQLRKSWRPILCRYASFA